MSNQFEPKDFAYNRYLERKIYKKVNTPYIYASLPNHTVRMLMWKEEGVLKLAYPITKSGKATLVKEFEDADGNDIIDEDITLQVENLTISHFMDNLGKNDIVYTHQRVYRPDEISDEELQERLLQSLS